MQKFLLILLLVFLSGCGPLCYGPDELHLYNKTDSNIFLSYSCVDSFPCWPIITLFDTVRSSLDTTICRSPYEAPAHDSGIVGYFGTFAMKKEISHCRDSTLTVFFIGESTLKTHTWEDIYAHQLYFKKIRYTANELEKMNWCIKYPD